MSERPMHQGDNFQRLTALYQQGETEIQNGQFEEAVETFSRGLAIDDYFRQRYVTMYAQRAHANHMLSHFEAAVEDYTRAIDMEPEMHQAQYYFQRGMCHGQLLDHDSAVADYSTSLALYNGHPGPYHLRAKLYVEVYGRYRDAIPDLEALLAFGPNDDAQRLLAIARAALTST